MTLRDTPHAGGPAGTYVDATAAPSAPAAAAAAYGDLVSGLLDGREDLATARFDLALAEAVASGEVSAETARVLRFWQRAAVREVVVHAESVLPPALAGLDQSRVDAAGRLAADEELLAAALRGNVSTEGTSATTLRERTSGAQDRRQEIVAALTRSTLLDLRAHH